MRIAVIDDDKALAGQISDMIADKLTKLGYTEFDLNIFENGQRFLESYCSDRYDIAIIDIFMNEITGIELARQIRSQDENIRIVFCSSSNEFASESYEVEASYYIYKPVTGRQIELMLKRMKLDIIEKNRTLVLPDGHTIVLRNIVYTEYSNHVVTIHLKDDEAHKIRVAQKQMETLLLDYDYFFSPVKGIIVNFYEIAKMTEEDFVLRNGRTIHITRRKSREARDAYLKFRFDRLKRENAV